jgi:hypothetical protein
MRPQSLDQRRAKGQVWHEMTIHDIKVNPVGTCRINSFHLIANPAEISGQNRRGDYQIISHFIQSQSW